ncbi:MAG: DUF1788 domain-containing protein [Saprospiraceae bacterium]
MNVDNKYRAVLDHLLEPRVHDHAGDKTICYLTFPIDQILEVKRKLNTTWISLAKNRGLEVELLSLHTVLQAFFAKDEYRIEAGEDAAEDLYEMKEVFASLGSNLDNQEIIDQAILAAQNKVGDNGILFITDLEALHPYTRFGPIEARIYNEIKVPIVVFYPGERSGSALKFLGFYPEDGNYRSDHY